MTRTLAIDAHSMIFRSFFAAQASGAGLDASLNILRRMLAGVLDGVQPTFVLAARDPGGPTYRHEIDPEYKASRGPTPEGLKEMIPAALKSLEDAGIPVLVAPGFEADDILATLAARLHDGHELVVLSSDRDLVGLVRPGVDLLLVQGAGKHKRVRHEDAHEVFGVPAHQVADYKALVGDSSDNIPGVRGIGPKTAVSLLQSYPDLDAILAAREELKPAVRGKLDEQGMADARRCLQLAQLHEAAEPIELDAAAARWSHEKLQALRGV